MQRLLTIDQWQRCVSLEWHDKAPAVLLQRKFLKLLASEPLVCNLMSSVAKVLFATFRSCKQIAQLTDWKLMPVEKQYAPLCD
jgi:hypothetical protein